MLVINVIYRSQAIISKINKAFDRVPTIFW